MGTKGNLHAVSRLPGFQNCVCLLLLAALAAGGALWLRPARDRAVISVPPSAKLVAASPLAVSAPVEMPPAGKSQPNVEVLPAPSGRAVAMPARDPFFTTTEVPATALPGDPIPTRIIGFRPDQTSWEAPFDSACWNAVGWEFENDGMHSTGMAAAALFRRPYRRLMLECRIAHLTEVTAPLRLRLTAAATKAAITLAIDERTMAVTDESHVPARLIKQNRFSPDLTADHPGHLRLAATGNRLTVSWNGTVLLTCDQPAGHSGRDVQFEFLADRTPYRITALRIEGE